MRIQYPPPQQQQQRRTNYEPIDFAVVAFAVCYVLIAVYLICNRVCALF